MVGDVDYLEMLENMPAVTMRVTYEDGLWKTWYVSESVEKYGFSRQEFLDGTITWNDILHPDDRAMALKQAHGYVHKQLDDFRLRYRILTRDNESVWITDFSHINRDPGGAVLCVDSMLVDTTQVKMGEDTLRERERRQAALNDILLGLHDSDLATALRIVLGRAGSYLDASRVTLVKWNGKHEPGTVVSEWLNRGIASAGGVAGVSSYPAGMPEAVASLQNTGMHLVNANAAPGYARADFAADGLVAAAVFAVSVNGEPYGYLRVDDCVIERVWSEETAAFLKIVANLASSVLMRVQTEERLKVAQRACETALDNVECYIFVTDSRDGRILFANRAFRNVFGAECVGRNGEEYISPGTAEKQVDDGRRGVGGESLTTHETYLERTGQWLSVTRELAPWFGGREIHLVTCCDITMKKRYEDDIKRLAFTDHLTGLPNRYRCDLDLANAMELAKRTGRPGHLFFMDLDDFKIVNDGYGHDYGDGVLVAFAQYIRELFGDGDHVYRFGGDEFVILVNQAGDAEIRKDLSMLLERAKRPWRALGKEFYCSLSIGVVAFPVPGDDPRSIVKKADIAMYQAKRSGKNNFAFYTEGLDTASIARSEMELLLRKAIENNFQGFEVYYQTYSETATRQVVGAEALVRLRDPNGGLLLPEQFLALAEYLGLIVPLGNFVMAEAARRCREINDAGLADFSMTVNLSSRQFKQKDVVSWMEGILAGSGVKAENMVIGIKEGVAVGGHERMLALCAEFRKKGLKVALDDFGTGSLSFINMRNLPVDVIKVSPKYIDEIHDRFTGSFLRLITDLSHYTGRSVCMHGVETEEQFAFCRQTGIDLVQGFLLHRPGDVNNLNRNLGTGLTGVIGRVNAEKS